MSSAFYRSTGEWWGQLADCRPLFLYRIIEGLSVIHPQLLTSAGKLPNDKEDISN